MKSKSVSIILFFLLALSIFFDFWNAKKFDRAKESIVNQSIKYVNANKFLKRCVEYTSYVVKERIPILEKENIMIYFPGNSCFTCLESLLKLLDEEYGLQDNILIIVDKPDKVESLLSHNDAFDKNYKYILEPENLLGSYDLNDILVFKNNGSQLKLLEYRPEEEDIFKEYFEAFLLN